MTMNALKGWKFPITPARVTLLLLAFFGIAMLAYRFAVGLGSATNLNDSFPWGLWIGFDMMSGVALAAGGFVMAFYVEIVGKGRFHRFLRPAIVTAFIGYILAIVGLLGDLGLPWFIYHPIYMWNIHSVMFEVAWCVIIYTTVLFVEFLPMPLERLGMKGPLSLVRKIMPIMIVLGIVLSTLHQSSLGSLFLLMGHRLHPLWWSPIIPVNFLLTAICVGFGMVIFESILSAKLLKHHLDMTLLGDMAKPFPWVLLAAFAVRLGDLAVRGKLSYIGEGSLQSVSFMVEVGLGLLLPAIMLLTPAVRYHAGRLFSAATLVVLGVVLNRINVSIIGMFTETSTYAPKWTELVVSVGLVSLGVIIIAFINENMPVQQNDHT